MVQNIANTVTGTLQNIPFIGGLFGAGESTPVQQFAGGGMVQGAGTSTSDRGNAITSPGEYVVNAQASRQNLALLEAVNSGFDVASMMQLMPLPLPPIVSAPAAAEGGAADLPPMQFNISFGDIIIQNATNGTESAYEFLETIEPQLQRKLRDLMQDLLEKMR